MDDYTQEQLDRATGEIMQIIAPFFKHPRDRAANVVQALMGCDTYEERFTAVEQGLNLDPSTQITLVGLVLSAWFEILNKPKSATSDPA